MLFGLIFQLPICYRFTESAQKEKDRVKEEKLKEILKAKERESQGSGQVPGRSKER